MVLAGPWPVHCPLATLAALTLPLCCVPSAYTEPYKVCPISAVAPKEDLTSDEERGSSEEEEDSAARDPSLPHKVGGWPVGCGGQRREGGGKAHSLPSPGGGSFLQTAEPWLDAEAESRSALLPEDTRQTGATGCCGDDCSRPPRSPEPGASRASVGGAVG